tara:strand:+ start:6653 stop:8371 length:1719 start_codon:yes stop_codon:yes gene_type:complete
MEKIAKLKKLIKLYGLDGYIIPKNDEFFNEYVPNHKDRLKFISNFSGSFGLALILKNKNYLFVDGRYTLQANIQSGNLFKIVTFPNQFPKNIMKKKNLKIGFDSKTHTKISLKLFFGENNCELIPLNINLVDKIWFKKEKLNYKKFYCMPDEANGQNLKFKINKLLLSNKKMKVDIHFITAGENIAWLLNIRGGDSEYTPLPNCYLVVDKKKNIYLFCNLKKISNSFLKKLKIVKVFDINQMDIFLSRIRNKRVSIDSATCSIYFENILKRNNKIVNSSDQTYYLKSIKTKKEINNIEKSHLYDGVALTKFLIWLKKNFIRRNVSEISAQEKLLKFRKKNKYFKYPSFPTISGSGPNGAIIHYRASKKSNRKLKKDRIYLVDSGGQYNFGTTDVTRTISLNNKNIKIKNIFTRVLKGHIAVANYKLKNNTTGSLIDIVARQPLKQVNLDYSHGTGHGVGYFLNVHEGPQAISKNNKVKFKEGMIVSNEPGFYEKGKFGIRIENLIHVKKKNKKHYFENLTLVPIDRSLINKSLLKQREINWINNYHKTVFKKLSKYMNNMELKVFSEQCSEI